MPKKLFSIPLILVLVFVLGLAAVNASVYNGTVVLTCTDWTAMNTGSHILDRNNLSSNLENFLINIWDGAGTLLYSRGFTNVLGTYAVGIGSDPYDVAPQYNPIRWQLSSAAGNGLPLQIDFEATGNCDGLPTYGSVGGGGSEPPTSNPQPPAVSSTPGTVIPSGSVVGLLTADTLASYAPGLSTDITLHAGQTFWVVGLDTTEAYYKIVLANGYLWIPAALMVPTPGAPWYSTPLPTLIVD